MDASLPPSGTVNSLVQTFHSSRWTFLNSGALTPRPVTLGAKPSERPALGLRGVPFAGWQRLKLLLAALPAVLFFLSSSQLAQSRSDSQPQQVNTKTAKVFTSLSQLDPSGQAEARLEAGGSRSYELLLKAGDYVHFAVDQIGIDLVVLLFAPDGRKLTENDGPTGKYGSERVHWIAEETGRYRCELQSLEKTAPDGRYRVRVVSVRPAHPDDQTRVAAYQAHVEAVRLRVQSKAESVRKSLERYEEAGRLWHSVNEFHEEAASVNDLGYAFRLLSDYPKALSHYLRALALRRQIGDLPGEAQTLTNLGALYYLTGENRKAMEHYFQALDLRRQEKNPQEEALLLSNIGEAFIWIGDYQKALERLREALPLHRATGDRLRESFTLNNLGLVYAETGQYDKATSFSLSALQAAETHAQEGGNQRGMARVLHTLGLNYHRLGDVTRALEFSRKALNARQASGDRLGESQTLAQLGALHFSKGESGKALEHYAQALKLQRSIGSRRDEAATLLLQGSAYETIDLAQALECFQRALSLFRRVEDWRGEITSLFGVARIERREGRLYEALATIQPALETIESIRRRAASQEMRISHLAAHHRLYEFAIDVLMDLHRRFPSDGHAAAALQISERARARNLLESLAEAGADIRQGVEVELLESEQQVRERIDGKAERLVQLLNGTQSQDQAALLKQELESLLTQYREVQAEIRSRSPKYAALTQPKPLTARQIQEQIGDGALLLEYALGSERSILWAVTADSLQSYELPKRSVIEECARRVYELMTSRNRPSPRESGLERRRRIAEQESSLAQENRRLSRMILDPVSDRLGTKRLVIVADGVLQYLPFAALLVDEKVWSAPIGKGSTVPSTPPASAVPLVFKNEILSLPSASVLSVLQRDRPTQRQASRTVALFADPVFSSNDSRIAAVAAPKLAAAARTRDTQQDNEVSRSARDIGLSGFRRLRFSREEAEAVASLAGPSASFMALDFAASRSKLFSTDLTQYRILHLGTHGLLNSAHPELSGLIFSLVDEQRQPQNGFLKLDDVFNLKLQADLVVLSACQTALGKEAKGEGLVGLTRGFMYAGAPRVLASLWNVDDRATAELMKRFYEGMLTKHLEPAAALQQAQRTLQADKRWSSPYYWAGFILQGEWR